MTLCQFIDKAFKAMFERYGRQHWWPGDSELEIAVGAILTQNTSWRNVERAINALKSCNLLSIKGLLDVDEKTLADVIKPAGYFNVKAQRLKAFIRWLHESGGFDELRKLDTSELRKKLLSVKGIGRETADSMLLYVFERPVFVIDAYTRRIFERHGLKDASKMDYDRLRAVIEGCLPRNPQLFNEYHALIVRTGKEVCKRSNPLCELCPLNGLKID